MHRIEPDDLRRHLKISLTCMPSWVRRSAKLGDDRAIDAAVEHMMDRLFSRWWVVCPDTAGLEPGRFGKTEPLPCEPPSPPPPPPRR